LAIDNVDAEGFNVKLPVDVPVTVRLMFVVALSEPEVPVMVIGLVAAAAELLAAKVTTLEPVVGLVPKEAVTPEGRPEAASFTAPLKGLTSVTEIVSVPLAPLAIDKADAEGFSVKLPGETVPLQATPLIAKFVGTELVVPFQVPLKPNPE
jgi:hypothetical protein